MSIIFIMAEESKAIAELCSGLTQAGFACSIVDDRGRAVEPAPDLLLVEMDGPSGILELARKVKEERHVPVIALVHRDRLDRVNGHLNIDDFAIKPCDVSEVALRIKRLMRRNGNTDSSEVIRCGDLIIDLAKCEVYVGNKLVTLTFKEYELLKFLASNKERVFTRHALLDRVWGYDYYGGDRTVDVHVRRLRSKIEDSNHAFIDTVRNIGYRFKPCP